MPRIEKTDLTPALQRLNLNHLLYFWAVGKAGSFTKAAETLGVSQPSVSEQVKALEQRLGEPLFSRSRHGVTLSPAGEVAMRYAEEVVGLCTDLLHTLPLRGAALTRPMLLGTADAVPKHTVRAVLGPLLTGPDALRIVCREWRVDVLLNELALHRLDAVLCDAPIAEPDSGRLVSLHAGDSGITVCAVPALARRLRQDFPRSLHGAPMLFTTGETALRQALDRWFAQHSIKPRVVAEADDRALLHYLAEEGHGALALATPYAPDLQKKFGLAAIGELPGLREHYYVTIVNREHEHPGVQYLRARLSKIRPRAARG